MTRESKTPRAHRLRLSDIQCATCFRITGSRIDSTRLPQSFFPWTQKLKPWTTKAPLNYHARRKQKTDGPIDEATVFHPIADQSGDIAERTSGITESISRPDVRYVIHGISLDYQKYHRTKLYRCVQSPTGQEAHFSHAMTEYQLIL
ncbi:hypothetical protein FGIG_08481 [Fasciola gigantica]|uniref:Uncharacterized protein n=1 Tax=Fasciola gigantica TaxID=46835 RepID=A0A504YUH8_FASGI|nr:hypothetical protein FGIG_08481 [Fasciola gigantica]